MPCPLLAGTSDSAHPRGTKTRPQHVLLTGLHGAEANFVRSYFKDGLEIIQGLSGI